MTLHPARIVGYAAVNGPTFSRCESAGLPDEVHDATDTRLLIPLQPGARLLNVAMAAAIAVAEAGRQVGSSRV